MDYELMLTLLLVALSWTSTRCEDDLEERADPTDEPEVTEDPFATLLTDAPTTAAPGATAGVLTLPITAVGCGILLLCAHEPPSCNPQNPNRCQFASVKQNSGNNFDMLISAETEGYCALTLSEDGIVGNNDLSYICANDNGKVRFFTARLTDGIFKTVPVNNVNNLKGKVSGNKVECTFTADVTSAARANTFSMATSVGPYNSTDDTLGKAVTEFHSEVVDLADPVVSITNQLNTSTTAATTAAATTAAATIAATTIAATTTSHAITLQQSLQQASLISLLALSLFLL